MPFITKKCPKCGRIAETKRVFDIAGKTVNLLKCDHMILEDQLSGSVAPEDLVSLDGKKLFPYQAEGIKFIEKASGRCLIADEMGLGKTVQAAGFVALHDDALPVAYFVKSALKIQWQHEIMRWISRSREKQDIALAQVIETSKDMMLPGINHYIFSFDILRRFKNGSLRESFEQRGIKTVIIDECQAIKNPESERSRQVRELCKGIPNIICLSGTPIKNNAGEYFPVLNILKPERYPRLSRFLYNECDSFHNGYGYKVGGLKDPKSFQEKNKDFIIRRERKEVLPELPQINRMYQFSQLAEEVENAYKATFVQFRDDYFTGNNGGFGETSNILAYLSRMRHLTGLSKIEPCIEWVEEFLEDNDRKLTIFVHHKDVAEILRRRLSELMRERNLEAPLMLSAELDAELRNEVVQDFMGNSPDKKEFRVLIASTLASGEGLNLQKCSDCVLLERQWNPANEEQAEGRFIRIGQEADKVSSTYFVAVGTVDEFFARLVEQKREIVSKTLGGEAVQWDQTSLMKELAEILATQGGKAWNI